MTTEILRNMLLQAPWEVDDVESIIFDEIHFLADPSAGRPGRRRSSSARSTSS
jgi:ATP-dependent RNA helicase HelY